MESLEQRLTLRTPTPEDAAAIWRLVRDSGSLDLNTPYAYLLLCSDFADTAVVAAGLEPGQAVAGFVAGYRPPSEPEALFVWQVGVAPTARGQGLGKRLIHALLDPDGASGAEFLTATVTPDNAASLALFRGIARDLGVSCRETERFSVEHFPRDAGEHQPEKELRVGPLP